MWIYLIILTSFELVFALNRFYCVFPPNYLLVKELTINHVWSLFGGLVCTETVIARSCPLPCPSLRCTTLSYAPQHLIVLFFYQYLFVSNSWNYYYYFSNSNYYYIYITILNLQALFIQKSCIGEKVAPSLRHICIYIYSALQKNPTRFTTMCSSADFLLLPLLNHLHVGA